MSNATRLFWLALIALSALSGCSDQGTFEAIDEIDEPVFRRAKDLLSRGMENEALENYLSLIQKRSGNAPESHLDAGNIYLNHLRDPVSAIYHFKRCKSLLSRSSSPSAERRIGLVDDLIKTGTKEFAASFEAEVYRDPLERLKLLDTIEELREENSLLKEQLASTRTRLNDASQTRLERRRDGPEAPQLTSGEQAAAATPSRPPPAATRTYTIRSGDNLYKIARQVYGDSSRWQQILEANRNVISDPGNLKVGTEIVIPD